MTKSTNLAIVRDVAATRRPVKFRDRERHEYFVLDGPTADNILALHSALDPGNQTRFAAFTIPVMAEVAAGVLEREPEFLN